ncbi:hypothetical protein MIMGU_mgv1a018440mg, partial [Erythranthe guttata]
MIKIESFSVLEKYGTKKYETKEFVAGDYKCTIFIILLAGRTLCFQATKSEWGISKFISRKVLSDPSNGYITDDSCVFGAEVFVVKRELVIERVLLTNVNTYYNHALEISGFSQFPQRWVSEEFDAGHQKWKILLYPKGNAEGTGSHVSIYLYYLGTESVQTCFT